MLRAPMGTTAPERGASLRTSMNGKPVFSVPAKSVLNLDSGFKHKLLCDGPTFSAGSACAYSCSFCYVEDLMRKNPHWQSVIEQNPGSEFADVVIRRAGAVDALRAQLTDAKGRPKFNDPQDRRVIYASPLVDVAANMDLVRETVDMCKVILENTHWQIRLLSKSNLLPKVAQGILELEFGHRDGPREAGWIDRLIFGVSTGTLDDKLAAAIEIGTPRVSKRIESLHWLQDNGFRTYAMVCPSLPQPGYAHFAASMRDALRYDKCEHVWGEVINCRGDSFTRTYHALLKGGFHAEAQAFHEVSHDKFKWEAYARETFFAHARMLTTEDGPTTKLRFLQYVTKDSRAWWQAREADGAVLL